SPAFGERRRAALGRPPACPFAITASRSATSPATRRTICPVMSWKLCAIITSASRRRSSAALAAISSSNTPSALPRGLRGNEYSARKRSIESEIPSARGIDASTAESVECAASSVSEMTWFKRTCVSGSSRCAMRASSSAASRLHSVSRSSPAMRCSCSCRCRLWRRAIALAASFSACSSPASIARTSRRAHASLSSRSIASLSRLRSGARENLLDLLLQRLRGERLHDISVDACLGRLNALITLGSGRDHQHRYVLEALVAPHRVQQLDARHPGHVPIGDQEIDTPRFQYRQSGRAVVGLDRVREADLAKQVSDDPPHRREVVHDQHFHGLIDVHFPCLSSRQSPS